jgi:hypothetical protein
VRAGTGRGKTHARIAEVQTGFSQSPRLGRLSGCASTSPTGNTLPPAAFVGQQNEVEREYIIGALDELTVFVWRNEELGAKVQVRPDGRITTPLITDMVAVGKTPGAACRGHQGSSPNMSPTRSCR